MADGVDAPVDDVQVPAGHTMVDAAGPESEFAHLRPRDDAMVPPRQGRQPLVGTALDTLTS